MDITPEMVEGYITAVATALEAAGHTVEVPAVDSEELAGEIRIPDAWTDEDGRSGIALLWGSERESGWEATCHDPTDGTYRLHSDLQLGAVPAPEVLVRAVAAIVESGSLRAGRVLPDAAELLARYEGGRAPAPAAVDLIALTEADDGFGQCVVCGGEAPTYFGLFVTESSNTVVRTAWCSETECQKDRAQSMLQTVPVEKTDGGFRVSVAAAERELRAARRDRADRVRTEADGIRDRLHAIAESLDA